MRKIPHYKKYIETYLTSHYIKATLSAFSDPIKSISMVNSNTSAI